MKLFISDDKSGVNNIRIVFKGKPKNKKITKTLLREASNFYAKLLMNEKLVRKIHVIIDFTQRLGKYVEGTSSNIVYQLSDATPKHFEICLRSTMGYKPMLKTLAHEFVHVGQAATARKYDYVRDNNMVRWEKDVYNEKDLNYWDLPWEIEAHGKELGMYVRFEAHLEKKNKNGS